MQEGKSSSTAWGVTLARVAHVRFDDAPPIFDDSLAFELVEPEFQPLIEHYGPTDGRLEEIRRARAYLPFRQRYQEECLEAAHARGVRQFVLLGAGLDAYAFRQPNARLDLALFEVDFPATQKEKRARIAALGWTQPENLSFVPCDFESGALENALLSAGLDPRFPTYFAWMGVTVYLERAAIRATFEDVLRLSAPGSSIAFEYALPSEDLGGTDLLSRDFSLAQKNREREPFLSLFRLEEIESLVSEVGWKRLEPLDHEAASARVLAGRSDGLSIHMGLRLAEAFA